LSFVRRENGSRSPLALNRDLTLAPRPFDYRSFLLTADANVGALLSSGRRRTNGAPLNGY